MSAADNLSLRRFMELHSLAWQRLDALVRRDPSSRGLASYLDDDGAPLPSDLQEAATSLVAAGTRVLLVTGFAIITPDGPRAETDGPLGAIFLAGMLRACEIEVDIATDALAAPLVRAALQAAAADDSSLAEIGLIEVSDAFEFDDYEAILGEGYSHLVAIERVGPNHTSASITAQDESQLAEFEQLVDPDDRDTCRNMRGDVIDDHTPPLHWLFEFDFATDDTNEDEAAGDTGEDEADDVEPTDDGPDTLVISPFTTIGIVDGGNEIGCGNIPWQTLRKAVKTGPVALTACRIPTDFLIVSGISNWGAYGLGTAIAALADRHAALRAWTADREAVILQAIVAAGGVDGISKRSEPSVDGVPLAPYLSTFDDIRRACLESDDS